MKRQIRQLRWTILGVLLCSGLISWAPQFKSNYEDLVIIAHSGVQLYGLESKQFERIIFAEESSWPDGKKVHIGLMKTSQELGSKVADQVFEMSTREFDKYWLALVFEGRGQAPEFFTSEADLVRYVSRQEGAVGIVSKTVDLSGVQVIELQN